MAGGAQGDDDEMITAINVTPLVDVVLVLLIILMVTASYIVSRSIPMELPAGQGETTAEQRTLTVSIDVEGNYYIDAEQRTEAQLVAGIDAYVADVSEADRRAVIAADGRITHAQVIHVIDLLRRHGVTRFAINVRPEDLAQ